MDRELLGLCIVPIGFHKCLWEVESFVLGTVKFCSYLGFPFRVWFRASMYTPAADITGASGSACLFYFSLFFFFLVSCTSCSEEGLFQMPVVD